MGELAKALPSDQQPDVVVCHVDCSFGIRPRNLRAFGCPKILLAADSHWGERAMSEMVRYAASEPFDRVVVLYDRHHIPFYRAAGIKNVHWFPGLTFAHSDERIRAAVSEVRENQLALVGKASYHFRRQRFFAALIDAKLPLAWAQLRQSEVIAHYGRSLIGFNVAMNGDLNLRVFETIAGGAMLLTDRLSPDAGLDSLLREGIEKVSYDNAGDLVEKARHYLARPREAHEIGLAGRAWFDQNFSEEKRQRAFRELVFEGRDRPEFELPSGVSVSIDFSNFGSSLSSTLAAYDVLNELHRQQEEVVVQVDSSVPAAIDTVAATLPRIKVIREERRTGQPRPDFMIFGHSNTPAAESLRDTRCWCWDLPEAGFGGLQSRLAAVGLQAPRPQLALFVGPAIPVATPLGKAKEARRVLDSGDLQGALALARDALAQNSRTADAYLVLAELALEARNEGLFKRLLESARKAEPSNPRISLLQWSAETSPAPWQPARLLGIAWRAFESLDFIAAEKFARRALQADAKLADAYYVAGLAQGRLRERQSDNLKAGENCKEELAAFESAIRCDPLQSHYLLALALARRRTGEFFKAAEAFAACLALDPANATAWFGLGEAKLKLGDVALAQSTFSEGLARWPDDSRLLQYQRLAVAQSELCDRSFAAKLLALHAERTDCPITATDRKWQQTVVNEPHLGCVRALSQDLSITSGEAMRIMMLAFQAAQKTSPSLDGHSVPARTVLFGYQPWFGIDTRHLLTRAWDARILLVFVDGEPVADAPEMDVVDWENFRKLSHRGISLWSVCSYRLAVHLRTLPVDIDVSVPAHLDKVQLLYSSAAAAIDQANAFCDYYRPESILVPQGYDMVAAVLRLVGLQRGLRVIAIENTFHSERLLWDDISGIAVNVNQAKNYYWRYRDAISEQTASATVENYLHSMESLKSVEHTSPRTGCLAKSDKSKRTITYIGQVGVDSSVLFGLRGFASQVEVITALAAYAAENSCRLLIKLHPKESPHYPDPVPYYRRLTAGWLQQHAGFQESCRRLGAALLMDDENKFSTYDLIEQADVCVTITSQAGLEALLMQKEVVLCGDAFYGSLGFTYEVADAALLGFTLDRVLQQNFRRNDILNSRRFFHIFMKLYCVSKTEDGLFSLINGRPNFEACDTTEIATPRPTTAPSRNGAVSRAA